MDDSTRQIVFGVACPVAISVALLSVGFLKKLDEDGREPWPIRIPLAIGIPPVLAFLALYGWPTGADTWRTAAFAPLLGLAAAIILTYNRAPWTRSLVAVLLAAAVTFLFRPYTRPEHWVLQVLPAPAMILVLCVMEPLASRRRGPSVVFPLGLAVGAATGLIMLSGFLKLTIPLAALSFSMLILFLYSLRRPRFSLASGPMFVIFPTVLIAVFVAFLEAKFNARIQKTSVSPMAYSPGCSRAPGPLALRTGVGPLAPVLGRSHDAVHPRRCRLRRRHSPGGAGEASSAEGRSKQRNL